MSNDWFACLLCFFNSLSAIKSKSNNINFCSESYCYETDGVLRTVTSLENAQSYCKGDKWLLEIYESKEQKFIEDSLPSKVPILLNSVGTETENYVSIIGGEFPSDVVFGIKNNDFLYTMTYGSTMFFSSESPSTRLLHICCHEDRYEIMPMSKTWFEAVASCASSKVFKQKGHLATFDGLTAEEINDLHFVKNLLKGRLYWIGYSKLTYQWNHAKTNVKTMDFKENHPIARSSQPGTPFFLFFIEKWEEKRMGEEKFLLICMEEKMVTKGVVCRATPVVTGITKVTSPLLATILYILLTDKELMNIDCA